MVVDDTPENLNLIRDMLQERGYRVLAFPNGRMALNAAAKNPPDIILLDILMPEMDGFEVAKRLKADEALQEIPILFISALGETENKVKALAAGGVDYVTKPFQFEEVQARVETHLRLRKMSLELERYNLHLEELVREKVRQIQASTNKLNGTLNATADGILAVDEHGSVLFSNDRFAEMWRIPADTLESGDDRELIAQISEQLMDPDAFIREVDRLYHSQEDSCDLLNFKDGRVFECVSRPLNIEHGKQSGRVWSFRDVSEFYRQRRELEESKERYQSLVNNISVGIYRNTGGPRGKFLEANPGIAKMFGYESVEEFKKSVHISDLYRDVAERKKFVHHVQEKGYAQEEEIRLKKRDGTPFWGEITAKVHYDENGDVQFMDGMVHDITERKQAEEELQRTNETLEQEVQKRIAEINERKLNEQELVKMKQELQAALKEIQELVNSISSLLISLDHNWQIYRWNKAAEEILGISKQEAQGVYLHQCPVSWEWEKIESGLRKSKLNLKQVNVDDVSYFTADNVNGFLSITIHPVFEGDEATLTGFLILGTDITQKKMMESQFLQDQKMEAIGQLAAGIAHEINTPVQYVDGNTHYLKDVFQDILDLINSYAQLLEFAEHEQVATSLSAEIKQKQDNLGIDFLQEDIPNSLDESLEGLQRVAKIVRSMKDFAHPGGSDKVQVDINKALENTITICKNEWKYSSNIYTDYDPDLPPVPCFKDEINQVFLNIIVNSAQAVSESGSSDGKKQGTINVSTGKNSEYAEIKISDTGPGIPEHIRDRIFNPFFTTKEVGKGTGQGLYIAYSIVTEKHQGIMNFESEVGKGTTFFIKLPLNN